MGPNRRCCIPGCRGGYDSQKRRNKELGIRNKSLFQARNDAQVQKWRQAISRLEKEFSKKDVVCEDHFPEDSITRYTEIKMKDGSIVKWERGVPELKPDACPTLFLNSPKDTVRKATKGRQSTTPITLRVTGGNDGSALDATLFDGLSLLAEVAGKKKPLDV
ncbi:uncharacterized protein LOC124164118 [Ischnura elegans]|uniref:uncharacterized protein LOC124164118 n=1 Tax=Ischnura elegans TaxID=197161 RepID=UPI001ED8BB96|nr:uncharacterized protein LOC124164118 [Ischnura elegans]